MTLSQEKMVPRFCTIGSVPREYGISFTVPDRVIAEISDKKRVMGRHPMRIFRIPSGGPQELNKLVHEAEKESPYLRHSLRKINGGIFKKAYHRSRFNDWYIDVIYFDDCSETWNLDTNN